MMKMHGVAASVFLEISKSSKAFESRTMDVTKFILDTFPSKMFKTACFLCIFRNENRVLLSLVMELLQADCRLVSPHPPLFPVMEDLGGPVTLPPDWNPTLPTGNVSLWRTSGTSLLQGASYELLFSVMVRFWPWFPVHSIRHQNELGRRSERCVAEYRCYKFSGFYIAVVSHAFCAV